VEPGWDFAAYPGSSGPSGPTGDAGENRSANTESWSPTVMLGVSTPAGDGHEPQACSAQRVIE